jgi:hypothetical protein
MERVPLNSMMAGRSSGFNRGRSALAGDNFVNCTFDDDYAENVSVSATDNSERPLH